MSIASNRPVVVVLDDQPDIRFLIGEILHRVGCEVLLADSGAEALALARGYDGPIDLLFTDVLMPDQGGNEASRAFLEMRPNVPVLFCSGRTRADLIRSGHLQPHDAFIGKPFTVLELTQTVKGMLRSS